MKIEEVYTRYGTVAAKSCAKFLKQILPKIAPTNWWQTTVLDKLSEEQKRDNVSKFEDLDFAKLLTIFDNNWVDIVKKLKESKKDLKRDARSIVIAMKTYRIHSAHFPVGGLPTEDIIHDFDALWRFLVLVEADGEIIQEIKNINKLGPAHDFDENEIDRIINSIKQKPKKKAAKDQNENKNPKTEKTKTTTQQKSDSQSDSQREAKKREAELLAQLEESRKKEAELLAKFEEAKKKVQTKPPPSSKKAVKIYKIGDRGPAGGFVFYDKGDYSDGWRYLEVAPNDLGEAEWGLRGIK